jgi:predicted Rossmann fold flavoprotein
MNTNSNVIVIGAGAAGFFGAIQCKLLNPNLHVVILEKTAKVLQKVRVSGGGRCNVTHACFDNLLLTQNYPRGEKELRNVFAKFSVNDTVSWFQSKGVKLKTELDGRMFPDSNTSETIVNCLLQQCQELGIEIKLNIHIEQIGVRSDGCFELSTKENTKIVADKVLVATGGNSKMEAYQWLKKLGHEIISPIPSLFTFNVPNNAITQLMGLSVNNALVKIGVQKLQNQGPLLITHWGFSGPAILKLSAFGAKILHDLNYQFEILIDWCVLYSEEKIRLEIETQRSENSSRLINNQNLFELPKRLWEHFCAKASIDKEKRWADLSKKQINTLTNILKRDIYKVQGKTTFKEEFVTCGGVNLKEIELSRMESKLIPNLFFAGEVINVDGITGGFNFQNAWSTATTAALAIANNT